MNFTRKTKIIILSLATILTLTTAQADSSFIAYQGVAYDNGVAKQSTTIDLQFTIKDSGGATVYQETKTNVATTDKGFFSHQIGSGTPDGANPTTYANIPWADGFKLNVQVDYGSGLTDLGDQDLTSTVYAHKAKTADSATTATALATDPTACTGGQYVSDIGANGTLTCATPASTSYTAGSGITLSGTTFSHTDTSSQNSINNSGATVIQDLTLDANGHLTGASSVTVAASSHTHTTSTISSLDGSDITSGTIDDARLPATITSNITGSAASATTATNASNVYIQQETTIPNEVKYIPFVDSSGSGNKSLKINNHNEVPLTYNPSTQVLNATASWATNATNADNAWKLGNVYYTDYFVKTGLTSTIAELNYVDGVTSNIQTQLNGKLPLTGGTLTGTITAPNTSFTLSSLGSATATALTLTAQYGLSSNYFSYLKLGATGGPETSSHSYSLKTTSKILAAEFHATSDKRVKTDIQPLTNALSTINRLKPSIYTKRDKVQNGNGTKYGFIAQDLEEVIPEAVTKSEGEVPVLKPFEEVSFEEGVEYKLAVQNGKDAQMQDYNTTMQKPLGDSVVVVSKQVDDFRTVDYNMVFTHAVAAIQEQQEEIKSLKDEIAQIKEALKVSGIQVK